MCAAILSLCFTAASSPAEDAVIAQCVETSDLSLVAPAFHHGYVHNLVNETVNGAKLATLTIQCVTNGEHIEDVSPDRPFSSVWTRDLYWGFQGWAQAGDDSVLGVMKSSIKLLIHAKNRNQALGQSKHWPLDDGRFYVPQAYTTGLNIAMDFFPWCSESQAHFVLLARDYLRLSGDIEFIKIIWPDICYVTKTLELMDTNGNSLPDRAWGSYDYQNVAEDNEEPLLCATTYAAYRAVAELANEVDEPSVAERMNKLAERVAETMRKPIAAGGLWKPQRDGGGYFVNIRHTSKGNPRVDERFIPYENLGPMFFGVTTPEQDRAIFQRLDGDYAKYYDGKYGPLYVASTAQHEKSEVNYSSAPWLGFLDVYLRCKKGHTENRSRIFAALIEHARDIPPACFTEGLGIYGYLTGGAGRSWDNGNFFHALIVGVYGVEKTRAGVCITPPTPMKSTRVTELANLRWRDAVYDLRWKGFGGRIDQILVDGEDRLAGRTHPAAEFVLTEREGRHSVVIVLGD